LAPKRVKIQIFPDQAALIKDAVAHFIALANTAIRERGVFSVALSGGNTPQPLYEALAANQNKTRLAWDHIHLFWGDERYVPHNHRDSNYLMVKHALLDHVSIPQKNIHPVPTEINIWQAAERYEHEMQKMFTGEWPNFDLILLGMGEDGHTASLFPHSAGLHEEYKWFIANFANEPQAWRLSLSKNAINAARNIFVIIQGADKANMVASVLAGPDQPFEKPIQLISPVNGEMVWLIDQQAAQLLPSAIYPQ